MKHLHPSFLLARDMEHHFNLVILLTLMYEDMMDRDSL